MNSILILFVAVYSTYSANAFNTVGHNNVISPLIRSSSITTTRHNIPFLLRMSNDDDDVDDDTTFDSASSKIIEEKDMEYENQFDDGDEELLFASKKGELDELKKRVNARAAKMKISESVATAQAISIAETKARNKEEWNYDEITAGQSLESDELTEDDLPKRRPPLPIFDQFLYALIDVAGFKTDPDEMFLPNELSELDIAEIENIQLTPIWERIKYVIDCAKPPSWNTANNLFSLMWIIFLSTFVFQTWFDIEVRQFYVNLGFLPTPGSVSYADFAGMEAPEGFTLGMTPEELAEFASRPMQ